MRQRRVWLRERLAAARYWIARWSEFPSLLAHAPKHRKNALLQALINMHRAEHAFRRVLRDVGPRKRHAEPVLLRVPTVVRSDRLEAAPGVLTPGGDAGAGAASRP